MKAIYNYWWILLIQGLLISLIGSLALVDSTTNLNSLIEYLALVFLVFGVVLVILALRARKSGRNWLIIISIGVTQSALGLAILFNPDYSSMVFKNIIGFWALAIAIIQLVIAFTGKKNRILFISNALVSGFFGILILWYQFESESSITLLVAIYSVLLGITIMYYSNKIRRLNIVAEPEEIEDTNP